MLKEYLPMSTLERAATYCNGTHLGSELTAYLLTHSTAQSPSWEANWFAASQEIPRISRNPKVHSRTHKRPPPVSILGQPNPVHIPTFHLLEIHPNIIRPSTPRSPQWPLSLRVPHQDPVHPPLGTGNTRHKLQTDRRVVAVSCRKSLFYEAWNYGTNWFTCASLVKGNDSAHFGTTYNNG